MEHGERADRVERAVRVAHLGGIPDGDLHAGKLRRERRGGGLIPLQRGQPAHPLAQPPGRRPGAGTDLQHLLAEVHPGGHRRQYLVLDVGCPLRAPAQLVVVGVHPRDATVRPRRGQGRSLPFCVAGRGAGARPSPASPRGTPAPGPTSAPAARCRRPRRGRLRCSRSRSRRGPARPAAPPSSVRGRGAPGRPWWR